ncbi:MAG: DNA repair protein RecN [Firmicutes bacterium]|nr:DNA repair protein RecN [Bacillota bacterium]
MLKRLRVSDFAIIEQIELYFFSGMTVLTGETGAGKSILIDAISLLLGDRASQDMIRTGKEKAVLEAVFEVDHEQVHLLLRQFQIEIENDELTIYREITQQNKNIIKLNGNIVTLQQLKEITKYLADVHSQFDTQRLINPSTYMELIDGFNPDILSDYFINYHKSLSIYKEKFMNYQALIKRKNDLNDKLEMYKYQLKELSSYELVSEEEQRLIDEESILENFDKIYLNLQSMKEIFENERILDHLYDLKNIYEKLTDVSKDFSTNHDRLNEMYYDLEDISSQITDKIHRLNFDPDVLSQIQERLHILDKLKTKYKKTIPELMEYSTLLQTSISEAENYEDYVLTSQNDVKKAFDTCLLEAKKISQVRKQIAEKIIKELKMVLKDLVLPHTEFDIIFYYDEPASFLDITKFKEMGLDEVDFLLSTNLGEPLKPISKTASGGEMSRIMLAFKTIFIRSQQLSTIIFDEIDTGISGFIAKQIAKKIKEISLTCQVISITHIPQVVAIGNHHLKVQKIEESNRTKALATYLDFNGRIQEIAEMISGETSTESSIQSAKELLLNA